ncbi:calpain-5-like isoform X3 [Branchiostoma floridae]|uniref:Calpain-5-like isoform X3 n=1 Tax=Branchiostoma floridae TaxID=7739 RepID=A0A9J7M2H8_BRAFL|nr:calpain-5-like isoform X3 [Branchiostoma floridae]
MSYHHHDRNPGGRHRRRHDRSPFRQSGNGDSYSESDSESYSGSGSDSGSRSPSPHSKRSHQKGAGSDLLKIGSKIKFGKKLKALGSELEDKLNLNKLVPPELENKVRKQLNKHKLKREDSDEEEAKREQHRQRGERRRDRGHRRQFEQEQWRDRNSARRLTGPEHHIYDPDFLQNPEEELENTWVQNNMVFGPTIKYYKGQNYSDLKKECEEKGQLFTDPEFPAAEESLWFNQAIPARIEWKRPRELCDNPRLFVEGVSSNDLNQGQLGNCWFVAAVASLTLEKDLWKEVIPDYKEQEWDTEHPENYQGIFRFRFWRFGTWTEVVVDDLLPTINGQLVYNRSKDQNELWSSLLEKAYAKLAGCYEALQGGNTLDALVDFTGGVAEPIALDKGGYREDEEKKEKLFKVMHKAAERGSLLTCSIRVTSRDEMEASTESGLVKGHAYSVTAVKKVKVGESGMLSGILGNQEKIYMIRMRNPWGQKEWRGPWSDDSPEWQQVSSSEKEKLGLVKEDDGEFWMCFDDWITHFTDAGICRLINTSLLSIHKTWVESRVFSRWRSAPGDPTHNRAGGCMNNRDTYLQNPQVLFDVDKDEDTVLISLSQPDTRQTRKETGGKQGNLTMGFAVYRVELNRKYRLHTMKEKVADSIYINTRSNFVRTELRRGRYVVIPTTFDKNEEGDMMLRIFTDTDNNCKELHKDQPTASCFSGILGYPQAVTSVHLHSATGLSKKQGTFSLKKTDTYAVIKSGSKSAKTRVIEDSSSPEYDEEAIFYRKDPRNPIKIQIWKKDLIRDDLLGEATMMCEVNNSTKQHVVQLQDKDGGGDVHGSISVSVTSHDDLTAI